MVIQRNENCFYKQNFSSSKLVKMCIYLEVQSEFLLVIFTSIDEVITWYAGYVVCEVFH